jgi:hypothetical protein
MVNPDETDATPPNVLESPWLEAMDPCEVVRTCSVLEALQEAGEIAHIAGASLAVRIACDRLAAATWPRTVCNSQRSPDDAR